jgi:hypothetical protein
MVMQFFHYNTVPNKFPMEVTPTFPPLLIRESVRGGFFHSSPVWGCSLFIKEGLEKRSENQDNVIRERSIENHGRHHGPQG